MPGIRPKVRTVWCVEVHTVFYPAVRIEEVKKTFNFFFLFSFIYFLTWGMGDGWVSENLMLPCLP